MSDDWDDYGEAEDDDDDYPSASKQKNFLAQMKQNVADAKDEQCVVCGQNVVITLQLRADGKVFHKACFRCKQCNQTLSLGNFAALEGKYYCKPHFKQLFKLKGNYSEGFGEEDHKKKWLNNSGGGAPTESD